MLKKYRVKCNSAKGINIELYHEAFDRKKQLELKSENATTVAVPEIQLSCKSFTSKFQAFKNYFPEPK